MGLVDTLLGNSSTSRLKKLQPYVKRINEIEPQMKAMTDDQLRAQTALFRERLKNGETLDDIMAEAFATVREAAVRTVDMRHFDVQLFGGMVLHQGRISEMKTGEGKTLVATLPAYLNALIGEGVHVVTVNDYLAKRDAQWMGKIYRFLGMTVGCVINGMERAEKQAAYNADITYGTNNEFGFDYLRDNMVVFREHMVQRELSYAIIDEVDSILIDEARTPLIISGEGEESSEMYIEANRFVRGLQRGSRPHGAVQLGSHARRTGSGGRRLPVRHQEAHRPAHRGGHPQGGDSALTSKTSAIRRTWRSTTISCRRCAPTRCSSAIRTTSCRTAKC